MPRTTGPSGPLPIKLAILVCAVSALTHQALAQATSATGTRAVVVGDYDVSTIDGMMAAVYGLLSGGIGEARDWDQIRALYYPGARMTHTSGMPADDRPIISSGTVEGWIAAVQYVVQVGFHETELHRRVEEYGTIAHVFSTYEYHADDGSMRGRGINSFQLYFDGTRYWIMSVIWSGETPTSPIPGRYAPSRQ